MLRGRKRKLPSCFVPQRFQDSESDGEEQAVPPRGEPNDHAVQAGLARHNEVEDEERQAGHARHEALQHEEHQAGHARHEAVQHEERHAGHAFHEAVEHDERHAGHARHVADEQVEREAGHEEEIHDQEHLWLLQEDDEEVFLQVLDSSDEEYETEEEEEQPNVEGVPRRVQQNIHVFDDGRMENGIQNHDYHFLLNDLSNKWILAELDHTVSKTASNAF